MQQNISPVPAQHVSTPYLQLKKNSRPILKLKIRRSGYMEHLDGRVELQMDQCCVYVAEETLSRMNMWRGCYVLIRKNDRVGSQTNMQQNNEREELLAVCLTLPSSFNMFDQWQYYAYRNIGKHQIIVSRSLSRLLGSGFHDWVLMRPLDIPIQDIQIIQLHISISPPHQHRDPNTIAQYFKNAFRPVTLNQQIRIPVRTDKQQDEYLSVIIKKIEPSGRFGVVTSRTLLVTSIMSTIGCSEGVRVEDFGHLSMWDQRKIPNYNTIIQQNESLIQNIHQQIQLYFSHLQQPPAHRLTPNKTTPSILLYSPCKWDQKAILHQLHKQINNRYGKYYIDFNRITPYTLPQYRDYLNEVFKNIMNDSTVPYFMFVEGVDVMYCCNYGIMQYRVFFELSTNCRVFFIGTCSMPDDYCSRWVVRKVHLPFWSNSFHLNISQQRILDQMTDILQIEQKKLHKIYAQFKGEVDKRYLVQIYLKLQNQYMIQQPGEKRVEKFTQQMYVYLKQAKQNKHHYYNIFSLIQSKQNKYGQYYKPKKPRWRNFYGCEQVKLYLQSLILERYQQSANVEKNRLFSQGVLLYGPEGCGKTFMAQTIAHQCLFEPIRINCRNLLKHLRIFDCFNSSYMPFQDYICLQTKRRVIILEQFQCFNVKNEQAGGHDRCINSLLTLFDSRFSSKKSRSFFICITSRPELIEQAFLRPGRLQQQVYIPYPDQQARQRKIQEFFGNTLVQLDQHNKLMLIQMTKGFSFKQIVEFWLCACQSVSNKQIQFNIKQQEINSALKQKEQLNQKQNSIIVAFKQILQQNQGQICNLNTVRYSQFIQKLNENKKINYQLKNRVTSPIVFQNNKLFINDLYT